MKEPWVVAQHPIPDGATPDHVAEVEARRRAARNTVYPCKDCSPEVFYEWARRQPNEPSEPQPRPDYHDFTQPAER